MLDPSPVMTKQMKHSVLLADDHAATVQTWRALIEPEFDVVGSVGGGRALVEAHDRLAPDVIVADIGMPEMNGIAAAEMILKRHPAARIILVTAYTDRALLRRGVAAGAAGYVLKVRVGDELLAAIRAVLRGELYIGAFPPLNENVRR